MITKEMVLKGFDRGAVKLIVDPNMESGTVCQIGDLWFYFGGSEAEGMEPEEYLGCVPKDEIATEIVSALEDIKNTYGSDEFEYYEAVLCDGICTTKDDRSYIVTEWCPHCESEIEMTWNVEDRGYKAFCPVCGKLLMLCDECQHADDALPCDYDRETDSCRFNQKRKRKRA